MCNVCATCYLLFYISLRVNVPWCLHVKTVHLKTPAHRNSVDTEAGLSTLPAVSFGWTQRPSTWQTFLFRVHQSAHFWGSRRLGCLKLQKLGHRYQCKHRSSTSSGGSSNKVLPLHAQPTSITFLNSPLALVKRSFSAEANTTDFVVL